MEQELVNLTGKEKMQKKKQIEVLKRELELSLAVQN